MPGLAQHRNQLWTPRLGHSHSALWAIKGQLGLGCLYSLVYNLAASSCQIRRGRPGPCSQNHIIGAKVSVLEANGVPLFEHFPLVCCPREEALRLGWFLFPFLSFPLSAAQTHHRVDRGSVIIPALQVGRRAQRWHSLFWSMAEQEWGAGSLAAARCPSPASCSFSVLPNQLVFHHHQPD